MTVSDNIIRHFPELTPELQKAAGYLLEHQNEIAIYSMRSLAAYADVQPSTLLRVAKALGYKGWTDLKDNLIKEVGLTSEVGYSDKAQSLMNDDEEFINSLFSSIQDNMTESSSLNVGLLTGAANLINNGKKIYICGFRASFSVAYYLYYIMRLFKNNVYMIDGLACNLEQFTRDFEEGDVVIHIGFKPISKEINQVFNAAKAAGCNTMFITDKLTASTTIGADMVLNIPTTGLTFFPSLTPAFGLVEGLTSELVKINGESALEKIKKSEHFFISSKAYL
ncbi:MurR/RpiR family transcriptional regulator [Vibrio ostreae]|uniref:MurR/RpiR family transcriptional regulator n=1 Tax=Vibrio ostreae TaxID=2841925 RepID=A0A975YPQ2_9VIBR|nr:MurR/RpiR family transcriptional regulator [Vibrio ostreae]QXO18949.1 MurR/RpiR family transcriptional regulator [Vibrio ostreae]